MCVRARACAACSCKGSQINSLGSSCPDNRNFADKVAQARQPHRLLKICLHTDKDREERPFNRTDLPLALRSLNLDLAFTGQMPGKFRAVQFFFFT